ncbi:Glycoside hydrolase [Akanthomyces lecanii RCEF 1005]|uniref:chitinase n=1 Tax=Akanthomyces lecanii RCEF 1005 TaxID=1081108 RepID=A0A162KF95_CORDF|nr:Glycoside hydrolase [Akanthomyces lecanii RCEF 1005]
MAPSWLNAALGATSVLLSADAFAAASSPNRLSAPIGYRGTESCPRSCADSGTNSLEWDAFRNMDQLEQCQSPMLFDFALADRVDDDTQNHRIFACTTSSENWNKVSTAQLLASRPGDEVDAEFQVGRGDEDGGIAPEAAVASLTGFLGQYIRQEQFHNGTNMIYGSFGGAAAGMYIGPSLNGGAVSATALQHLEDNIRHANSSQGTLGVQMCGSDYDSNHIFGFIATTNGTFDVIQDAMSSWYSGDCVKFGTSNKVKGKAHFAAPLMSSIQSSNSTNSTSLHVSRRGECRTVQVQLGTGCPELAKMCGISGADFTKYNPGKTFCNDLMPGQHVCCSAGTLPDYKPKPNKDGSCATATVHKGLDCASIAAANGLTKKDIEGFNEKKTWGWNGCDGGRLWAGSVICISKGTPPMPASAGNAVCGPQKPGTKKPKDMDQLADLNPCPLNACCDVWGQCGTTDEFCTDTGNGAPGTAKKDTNGCISNCDTKIVKGSPGEFRSIAYFEGYAFKRKCQYQDAFQIDPSKYTHLHFGFGTLSKDFKPIINDYATNYEFNNFRLIKGPRRILSFGGWDFSTGPDTYTIFREGTNDANRETLATNIANYIHKYNLDGVDIDWEYPSAPDIPGVPPGDKSEGKNYLEFLKLLKSKLNGKSLSIAAPASYWYLKGFPIKDISKVVDYIVFMTYDLHGQWDVDNKNAQIGCPGGNCLRSHVNLTETQNSLSMVTKAGVDSGKVVVGVTSYGRSFAMADGSCYGPDCTFTGSRLQSNANKGKCTDTAGYISNAEIKAIAKDKNRVVKSYMDAGSNSNVLVYDKNQWVAYMDADIRSRREKIYKNWGMGGSSNWATDLEDFEDPPKGFPDWSDFTVSLKSRKDPYEDVGKRTGNWTNLDCTADGATDTLHYTSDERWKNLDAANAWKDMISDWKRYRAKTSGVHTGTALFSEFFANNFNHTLPIDCGDISPSSNCRSGLTCGDFTGERTGPAAALIWNSFVQINEMYASYADALGNAAAEKIDPSLDDFQETFAPTPPEDDKEWLTILLDLVSMGTGMVAGPFVGKVVGKLPYFVAKAEDAGANAIKDKIKSVSSTVLTTAITIGSGFIEGSTSDWDPKAEAHFKNTMGLAMAGWNDIATEGLRDLFDGSDSSLDTLSDLLADGQFAGGKDYGKGSYDQASSKDANNTLEDNLSKTFYAYAIPAIWHASGHRPFIIDTGLSCAKGKDEDIKLKGACYEKTDTWYRLASPDDGYQECAKHGCDDVPSPCVECDDDQFKTPSGVDELGSDYFSKVSVEDLIIGSVRTYLDNGGENGGKAANPDNPDTLKSLMEDDVTTPGFIRMPVCSADRARIAWGGSSDTAKDYPCNANAGYDYCGDSTLENQTSDASPLVSGCKEMVRMLEDRELPTRWPHVGPLEKQSEICSHKSCKFGVTGKGIHGNVDFKVGAQDVIDLVKDSITKFGGDGRVGSKGTMNCKGNLKNQKVDWGLY